MEGSGSDTTTISDRILRSFKKLNTDNNSDSDTSMTTAPETTLTMSVDTQDSATSAMPVVTQESATPGAIETKRGNGLRESVPGGRKGIPKLLPQVNGPLMKKVSFSFLVFPSPFPYYSLFL